MGEPGTLVTGGLRRCPEVVVVDIPAQRATRVMLRQSLAIGAAQIGALMRRAGNRPDGSGTMSLALIWCLMAGQ